MLIKPLIKPSIKTSVKPSIKTSIKAKLFAPTLTGKWRAGLRHHDHLMKVGWAAAVGISVGVVAAALTVHHPSTVYAASAHAPYVVPVNATSPAFPVSRDPAEVTINAGDSDVIEQLRTRNRRLEALVTVLRQRAAERRQVN
jgi:hypothetical protein